MKKFDLEELFKRNPDLLTKRMNRYTIRSLLDSLSQQDLGDLSMDCGEDFKEEAKINLSLQLENILKMLRRNK